MEAYQVLARKFRPKYFSEVIGQGAIVTTLQNAVRLKRIAHAYLFCGSRGTGKTTLARIFAKALNCHKLSENFEPCSECSSCREIANGHSMDVLEIDGASHRGIEDIRQINETVGFVPSGGKYKIYLIDEVHMLTKEAFNALLKTLEEPPAHVKFFFATTEPQKIPPTILSRCQRFNLRRIASEEISNKLQSIANDLSIEVELQALLMIAELSEGSLRDAESLLDQVIAFQNNTITAASVSEILGLASKDIFFSLDVAGANKNWLAAFEIGKQVFSSGKNVSYFLEELIIHFRTLFLAKQASIETEIDKERYLASQHFYREEQLLDILEILMEAQSTLKFAPSERTALEMLLLKILRTHEKIPIETIVQRLEALDQKLSCSEDPAIDACEFPSLTPKKKKDNKETENPISKVSESTHSFVEKAGNKESITEEKPKTSVSTLKGHSQTQLEKESRLNQEVSQKPGLSTTKLSIQQQSRLDTLLQFTAKELNGSLKKEY